MPRFKVVETRSHKSAYLIDAVDEEAAKGLRGEIIEEAESDSWGAETISVEQVADDVDEVELP